MSDVDRNGDEMAPELNGGDFEFIGKPFHNDELLARLRVLVRLHRLQQQLVEQEHLQAVAETAGAITRELGQHLNAASTVVQRILAEANLSQKQLIDLQHLKAMLQHMIEIVRDGQGIQRDGAKFYPPGTNVSMLRLQGSEDPAGSASNP
jgi:DNA-binding response OmpR family regulator